MWIWCMDKFNIVVRDGKDGDKRMEKCLWSKQESLTIEDGIGNNMKKRYFMFCAIFRLAFFCSLNLLARLI